MSATNRKRSGPNGPDLQPAIERLRELARSAAGSGKVPEAPQHPDAELLELCATVLNPRAEAASIDREARRSMGRNATRDNPAFVAEMEKRNEAMRKLRSPMARVCRFSAKTPSGLYSKALVLRASYGGAVQLTLSLVDDLLRNPALRAALWAAGGRDDAAA